jgi:uncharacterized protein YidB (DUF937 family)
MLSDVVEEIGSSYGDIRALARSAAVSPKEVAAALAKAKPGTVDHVVLSLLAEYHPVVDSKPEPQE